MAKTKVFLMAGHGGGSPGAVWHERREAHETIKLVDEVYEKVRPHMPSDHELVKVPHSLDYDNGARWVKDRMGKWDIVIDFHFNAFYKTSAHGTETLYNGNKKFAKRVNDNVTKHLGLRNRGVKRRTDLYLMRLLPDSSALLEVCFLSNKSDMRTYDKKGVKAVANAVYSVVMAKNTTLPKPKPEPKPEPKPQPPRMPEDVEEPAKLAEPQPRHVKPGAKLIDARTGKVVHTYKKQKPWTVYATFTWKGVDFYQTKYSFDAKSWVGVPQTQFVPLKPEHGEEPPSEVPVQDQVDEINKQIDEMTEQMKALEKALHVIAEFLSNIFRSFTL